MKNFKRDLKFMCLSDAIANARPGEPLEVWYKGSPSPNRSILETFSLVARVHNQEQWSTLYFFSGNMSEQKQMY